MRRLTVGPLLVALVAEVAGCATLKTQTDVREDHLRHVSEPFSGVERTPRLSATPSDSGIELALATHRQCGTVEYDLVKVSQVEKREFAGQDGVYVGMGWLFGALFAGAGANMAANPGSFSDPSTTTVQARQDGIALAGVGGAILMWAVVETVRAMDGTRDLGEERRREVKNLAPCDAQLLADAPLRVLLDAEELVKFRTDAAAKAVIRWGAFPFDAAARVESWTLSANVADDPNTIPVVGDLRASLREAAGRHFVTNARRALAEGNADGARSAAGRALEHGASVNCSTSTTPPRWRQLHFPIGCG